MTGMTRNRDEAPLMRELHEVGLRHGVTLVVVAQPIDGNVRQQYGLLIDHKEETPTEDGSQGTVTSRSSIGVLVLRR